MRGPEIFSGDRDRSPDLLLLRERVLDGLRAADGDLEVQLEGVRRDRVPTDRLLLPHPRSRSVESDPTRKEHSPSPRTREIPAHGEPVLVAPPRDRHLVSGQADVEAVNLLANLAADEGVRELPRDVPLVRLPALRVGDDGFELCHGAPLRCETSIKGLR